jgi:predicted DNA-binding transcriptional regulator YafY
LDLTGKVFAAHRILRDARCAVSRAALQEKLECSRATTARVLAKLRDQLRAPVEYDRSAGGYRYTTAENGPFELPGLWFNASELHGGAAAGTGTFPHRRQSID